MDTEDFVKRCQKRIEHVIQVQNMFGELGELGLTIPYGAVNGERYHNVTKSDYVKVLQEDGTTVEEYQIDEDATIREFAIITKWARRHGYEVEKKYEEDYFKLIVTFSEDYGDKLQFTADRKVMCERKVVGTKFVPARMEDVVEWDCQKIAFTNVEI